MHSPELTSEALAARYNFLCRSTHPDAENGAKVVEANLEALQKLLQVDLLALARQRHQADLQTVQAMLMKLETI